MKKLFSAANLKMFIKFGCVGVLNTLLDTAGFFLLCDICGINELFSNVASYLISATNSYFLNSRLVYHAEKYSFGKYFQFLAGNICVLVISTLSIMIFARFFTVKTIAKLISMPITIILNFLIQRFIVFKKSADKLS